MLASVEEVKTLLRQAWKTTNELTVPITGAGSAAWEACISNLVSPGEVLVTFVNGYFGERQVDIACRYGADTRKVCKPWGSTFSISEIQSAIEAHKPTLVWICHDETSTGVHQSLKNVGDICRSHNCLLIVDAVTSFGGIPVEVDAMKIDVCYSASQKCVSGPAGISALTMGPRAVEKMQQRSQRHGKTKNW